jgi:DNA polymerase
MEPSTLDILKFHVASGATEAYADEPQNLFAISASARAAAPKPDALRSGMFVQRENVSVSAAKNAASDAAAKAASIEELAGAIRAFTLCPLSKFSTSTITGAGAARPRLLVIYETPSAEEDRSGEALAGETGDLVKNILRAIGMSLESDAHAMPFVSWRPPGGRAPTMEETEISKPFAERSIALASPRAILAMGSLPILGLLGQNAPLTEVRGKWLEYNGIPLMPTFSPAYLLNNREAKKKTWEDVQAVAETLKD